MPVKKPRSVTLKHAVTFEITPVAFTPFQSIHTLDLDRLSRARRAVVELGQFDAGCCKRTTRAVIKRGQVTEVLVDPCSEGTMKPTPQLAKLLSSARRKLSPSVPKGPRLPMPATRYFSAHGGDTVVVLDLGILCWRTCVDFLGTRLCTVCCTYTWSDQLFCATFPNLGVGR